MSLNFYFYLLTFPRTKYWINEHNKIFIKLLKKLF